MREVVGAVYDRAFLLFIEGVEDRPTRKRAVIDRAFYVVVACQPRIFKMRFCLLFLTYKNSPVLAAKRPLNESNS